jgi:hypothetical protein
MKVFFVIAFGGLVIGTLACPVLWSQATGQINGTVKDQSGAVLPGVEISASQTETGVSRNSVSDETGLFVLPNLPIGPYKLDASLPGFRSYVQTGIVLQVNSNLLINVTLEVGQVSEQVEVQANAALVETRNVGVGQVIENERILELPLNGRQATDLIVLAGAAVQTGNSNTRSMQNIPAISVAGGLSLNTAFVLDGAVHNNAYDNLNLPLPFPDALQEFKVETSALAAQYGMYSGGAVSAVTRSGTNDLHGNLFEFVRNDLFNARNYFASQHGTLKRNQFGGTLGGKIVKNKLFFFGGYQGTTLRQDPSADIAFVPTAAMMSGDFTAIASAACTRGRAVSLGAPFVNNRIDPGLFSKSAVTIANKLPRSADPCGRVTFGRRVLTNESQVVGRVDYQLSEKHSLFGRYLATSFFQPDPFSLDQQVLDTIDPRFDNLAQSYAFGDTRLMGPNTVNTFRLAVNRISITRDSAKFFSAGDVGIDFYTYNPNYSVFNITGGFNIGSSPGGPGTNRTTAYAASNDFSFIRGAHQLALGATLAQWRVIFNSAAFGQGIFTFDGSLTGLGLADFITGKLSRIMQAAPNTNLMRQWYGGVYGADTWQVTRRLTVTSGVRWEPFLPQVVTNDVLTNFSEERYKAQIKSTVFKNAPFGFYYPGDPGFEGRSGMKRRLLAFAPRLGLAWDPGGNGRMSIRASYALAFDMPKGELYTTFIGPPWSNSTIVERPVGGLDNLWQGYPGGNPFPLRKIDADAVFPSYGNYFSILDNNKKPTRNLWSLGVQKQIVTDWLVSATYMGSEQYHLWSHKELNPAVFIPGGPCTLSNGVTYDPCSTAANANLRRRLPLAYPNVGGTTMSFLGQFEVGGGTQSYHGLLLSAQRRAARGVTVSGNYTLSHCIGDSNGTATPGNSSYKDPDNRRLDRGNCDSDRRHIFNLTAVAQTPRFASPTLRTVATGWRLSGLYRVSSGNWMTVVTGLDRQLSGQGTQRPNQVLDNAFGNKSLNNYLNPAAFAQPALGSLGNLGPRNIAAPKAWQFDMALSRVFRIGETQRLEARAEAFNVTNSLRPLNPNTTLSSNIFGQITSSSEPRIMQFALKYVF